MKFGTGSNTTLIQKYGRAKVQNDIRTSKHNINKQTFLIFNCVTPVSVSLVSLARQLHKIKIHSQNNRHLPTEQSQEHVSMLLH